VTEWRRLSRLPESADYWRGLEARVRAATLPALARRHRRERWLSAALATTVTAAAAVVALLLAQPEVTVPPASLEAALAPTDPVALELLSSRAAPHISGLLPAYISGEAR
jgi:NhaP-type Na+/H+ or K+/H+ antiporter